MTKPQTHYVNNAEFLELLKERREVNNKIGNPFTNDKKKIKYKTPIRIAEELGSILSKIAHNLSYKMNFINYTYREEMVGDAIENCIIYIDNFDPDIGSNPFSYFTQICYFAFVRRINKESRQTEIKDRLTEEMSLSYETQDHDNDEDYHNTMIEFSQEHLHD